MCCFVRISRSGLTFILVSLSFGIADVVPVVDEDNIRAFPGLTGSMSEPAVGSNCSGAGCGFPAFWDYPTWYWL